jgi:hypothetical protein
MTRRIQIDCTARATIAETWVVDVPDDIDLDDADMLELIDLHTIVSARDEVLGDEDGRVLTCWEDITEEPNK